MDRFTKVVPTEGDEFATYLDSKNTSTLPTSPPTFVGASVNRLAMYEDLDLLPEEMRAALDGAEKLISTMRNNKKAALWLRKYGTEETK